MIPRRNRGGRFTQVSSSNREVASLKQKITSLQNSVKGRILKPSLVPPSFVSSPFNNVIIESKHSLNTGVQPVYEKDLASFLCNQIGVFYSTGQTTNFLKVEWRLHSISVWSLNTNSIRLFAQDFVMQESLAELCNSASFAQKNMYACTGYEFPATHQSHVFSTDSNDQDKRVLFQLQSNQSGTALVHSRISWRCAEQGKITMVYVPTPSCSSSICDDIERLNIADPAYQ